MSRPTVTNLDRLHEVVLGWPEIKRRVGNTFAHCHTVASLVELGESRILLLLPQMVWEEHVIPMLSDVLFERCKLRLSRSRYSRYEFDANGVSIAIKSLAFRGDPFIGWSYDDPIVEICS
jgi:hypothetical protein